MNRTALPRRRMVYLSGAVRKEVLDQRFDLGVLLTPNMGNRPCLKGTIWAADNGLFAGQGKPARPFGEPQFESFKALVARAGADIDGCLFAVVPDAPYDAKGTLARWAEWAPRFRAELPRSVPLAFVAQDGMSVDDIPWGELDALFIGGSDGFKETEVEAIVREARRLGKWIHMGRVNSRRRMDIAWAFDCDSADGTYIAFGPSVNLPKVHGWLGAFNGQPVLEVFRGAIAWTRLASRGWAVGDRRLHAVAAHTIFDGARIGGWYACPQAPGNRFTSRGEGRCIHCAAGLAEAVHVDREGGWVILPCPCELCYRTAFGTPAAPATVIELEVERRRRRVAA